MSANTQYHDELEVTATEVDIDTDATIEELEELADAPTQLDWNACYELL